jgi:hypothetical protein
MSPILKLSRRVATAVALSYAMGAHAIDVLVDFDHHRDGRDLDVASGQVVRDGFVLPYLAEFGITLVDRSRPDMEIRIGNLTQTDEPSPQNMFHAFASARPDPYSYRLVFDTPVDQLSFVRVGLLAPFSTHDGWKISAFDGQGHLLGLVSEPQVSQFGNSPEAAMRRFELPYRGIASLLVLGNLSTGGQTFESPAIDDLRFSMATVPEPHSFALMGLGLGTLALRALRLRRRHGLQGVPA